MKYWFAFIVLFFISIPTAHAALVFSEIMYDHDGTDTDHEWVEVYNTGDTAVSLVGIRFNDGSNHTLNDPPTNGGQGTLSIPANGYVIIAQNAEVFLTDYSGHTGTVIDTVMSLGNTGETIRLINDTGGTIIDATYDSAMGAAGDGKTLNWNSSTYVPGTPTPGSEAVLGGTTTTTGTTGSGTGGGTTTTTGGGGGSQPTTPKNPDPPKQTIEIIASDTVLKGVSSKITPILLGYGKEPLLYGDLVINFGDGTSAKIEQGKPIEHVYQYAGVYTIVLEWYKNSYITDPELSTSKIIRVEEPGISLDVISGGAIKIKNSSPKIADISDFKISDGSTFFVFPKRSRIAGVSAITIVSQTLGFIPSERSHITMFNPYGDSVATYPDSKNTKKVTSSTYSAPVSSGSYSNDVYIPQSTKSTSINITKNNLANASSSIETIDSKYLWLTIFILFIGALIVGILFIKNSEEDTEYELIDE